MTRHYLGGRLDDDKIKDLITIVNNKSADDENVIYVEGLGGQVSLIPVFAGICNEHSESFHIRCLSELRSCGAYIALSLVNFSMTPWANLCWHSFGKDLPNTIGSPINDWCFKTATKLMFEDPRLIEVRKKFYSSTAEDYETVLFNRLLQLSVEKATFDFEIFNPPHLRCILNPYDDSLFFLK